MCQQAQFNSRLFLKDIANSKRRLIKVRRVAIKLVWLTALEIN